MSEHGEHCLCLSQSDLWTFVFWVALQAAKGAAPRAVADSVNAQIEIARAEVRVASEGPVSWQ